MSTQLKRCLSLWEIVIYGVGIILGAGIYVLLGAASGIAGNMIWLSFLLAAVVASFTAMSYAELSTLFPKTGAEYIYSKAAFGSDLLAWLVGMIAVIIGFSTASAVAVGFAGYLAFFFSPHPIIYASILVISMTLINFWGIKQSTRFNTLATSIEVGGLLIVIIVGGYQIVSGYIPLADLLSLPEVSPEVGNKSLLPLISASALIFFAYIGFEEIANISEEAENPEKVLPKAFIYALVISTIIYILVAIVAVSVVPYEILAASDKPLSLIMEKLIGGTAPSLIALIALFATANTVLITLIVAARMLFGMAREGSMPLLFAKVHNSRRTPYIAVFVAGFISLFFLFFEDIEVLASISNLGIFILFFIVNMSNIVLRYKHPELIRPWKSPVNIGSFPIISALGVLSCLLMIFTIDQSIHIMGREYPTIVVGMAIFLLPIPFYFLFSKK